MKSFFSLINWILASIISYFLTPIVATIFSQDYSYMALHLVVSTVLFVISLLILSIVTGQITKTFLTVIPKSVDQSLGFAFGFAKGYFIIALIFSIVTTIYSQDIAILPNKTKSVSVDGKVGPSWLAEAKSYKILELGANMWQPIIDKVTNMVTDPEAIKNISGNIPDEAREELERKLEEVGGGDLNKVKKIQDLYNKVYDKAGKGYHKKEIEKMNRLIEAIE